jgi:hypothetical protein
MARWQNPSGKKIKGENLGYIREDKLKNIFKKGYIRGRNEYEYAKDTVVIAQQENRIYSKRQLN